MRIVIKIGTSTLTDKTGKLNISYITYFAKEISKIKREQCLDIILVSSGAIGAGIGYLNLSKKPKLLREKQALASIGQPLIMQAYRQAFEPLNLSVAQILLTRYDFDDRQRYINIRNSINELLLKKNVIPIINENDSIAIDEINFGDNDTLSALVSVSNQADMLFILTDVDGLYEGIPHKSKIIQQVTKITDNLLAVATPNSSSGKGTGGMKTKLMAAKIATSSGIKTFIINGNKLDLIKEAINGKTVGTEILANKKLQSRKSWIAFGKKAKGFVVIDINASVAIRTKCKSLLASGIISVSGKFNRGDTVNITVLGSKKQNVEVARGLSNYNSDDLAKILGKSSNEIKQQYPNLVCEEVVHKDNLVLIE
ncbi:MAG: glutamate 5-kinase [Endomicrobiia bacterium]|nr:glutamate 5-kinase [Endomicrobiaceae bacterium]